MSQVVTRLVLILDARCLQTSIYCTLRDTFLRQCKELLCLAYVQSAARGPPLLVTLCVVCERHVRRVLDAVDMRHGGPKALRDVLARFDETLGDAVPERVAAQNAYTSANQRNLLYSLICDELQRARVIGTAPSSSASSSSSLPYGTYNNNSNNSRGCSQTTVRAVPFILLASSFLRYTHLFQLLTQVCTVTMTGRLHAIAMDSEAIAVTEAVIGAGGKLARTSLDPNDVRAALQNSLVPLLLPHTQTIYNTNSGSNALSSPSLKVPVVVQLTAHTRLRCSAGRTFLSWLPGPCALIPHTSSRTHKKLGEEGCSVVFCGASATPALYASHAPSLQCKEEAGGQGVCVLRLMAVLAPQNVDETLLWGESWVVSLDTSAALHRSHTTHMIRDAHNGGEDEEGEEKSSKEGRQALWRAMYTTFEADALMFTSDTGTDSAGVLAASPFQLSFPTTHYIGYFVDRTRLLLRAVLPPELRVRRVYDEEPRSLVVASALAKELRAVRQELMAQYSPDTASRDGGKVLEECLTRQQLVEQVALRLRPMGDASVSVRLARN